MQRFYLPTEVITGRGCLSEIAHVAARHGTRATIVCGRSFAAQSGLLDKVKEYLRSADVSASVFDHVSGEANLDCVAEGIQHALDADSQMVIGLGGGSAIDTAKAIAGLVDLPGTPREYHNGRPLDGDAKPLLAIPTTSGTGAEVTKNAVLIDAETGLKQSIRGDAWFARAAFVDPETTVSMPPNITASTGSDALCQAIEAYTSIGASPITDALSMRAIELIGGGLLAAYQAGDDIAAREKMSMGSLMAGMAMASARLGGVHGMAHPLGSHFSIPHGVVCGLLLPYVMEYNYCYSQAKYASIARLLGEPIRHLTPDAAAQKAVERVRDLMLQLQIPEHLSEFGVTEDAFDQIIEESLPSGSLKHNPRPLAADDVRHILSKAL